MDAWHWNPHGSWSDSKLKQGYWLSDAKPDPSRPILISHGYKLPRRGNTLDEANDDGYSRLDDGNPKTFWKSNPYLSKYYTGEPDSAHPQWVVIDFGKQVPVNAVNILWGEPYAKNFQIEYANRGRVYFGGHPWNVWHTFHCGKIINGKGGEQFLKFGDRPIQIRYLRIWMTEGSGTAFKGSTDRRDAMGYAIREVMAGEAGHFDFDDHVFHRPDKSQTVTYASSTDPWHRAADLDPHVEQPGVDLIARCGITRGLPFMLSVPVLYDTPENAAALAAYCRKQSICISRYELGEEPDGQRVSPRDFGVLYAQSARAMRQVLPRESILGGPSFVTVDVDKNDDTYRFDHRWWIDDFRSELVRQGQSHNFQFLSFEWYPFDDVEGSETDQLSRACGMLRRAMDRLRPLGFPLVVGEANYSVFPCQQEVDLAGALLNTEMAVQFLTSGGNAYYYYSYEPNKLEESSGSWGNQMMLMQGKNPVIPLATYHALKLLMYQWMNPMGGVHKIFRIANNLPVHEQSLLSLFVLQRPDRTWSLLAINKNIKAPIILDLPKVFRGICRLSTYSADNYRWKADGVNGHPLYNRTPTVSKISEDQKITIPPWSLSVLTVEKPN